MRKIFSVVIFFCNVCLAQEYKTLSCVLHVHSNFSGTRYTIEDIVELAKQNNIDVVVLTDHLVQKVEFGVWPVRNLVKKYYENTSVMSSGIDKYLSTISKLSNQQKDVIIIPGVEVTPHYFWTVEGDKLVAKNLHKHMLVLNLRKKDEYLSLPVIHNKTFFSITKLILLIVLIILAILCFVLKLKVVASIFVTLFVLNLSLKKPKFHQYKDFYDKPYQTLIDHVNFYKNKMIIIWAHPEATNYQEQVVVKKINKLEIATQTQPYYRSLLATTDYDGFSIFAEGYRTVGCIGGIWDAILKEYLSGKRKKPVWCYSEIDFGETNDRFYYRKNILCVKEKTYDEVIKSLKNGSFYTLWRNEERELRLEEPMINSKQLIFGKTYKIDEEKVNIELLLKFSDGSNLNAKVYIIRNGEIVFSLEKTLPAKIVYAEEKPKSKSYYRIFIESKYPHMIATNPFFVE